MKKTVIINRAVPGSGKTTITKCILKALEEKIKGNPNNQLKQNQTPNSLSNDSPNDSQTRWFS